MINRFKELTIKIIIGGVNNMKINDAIAKRINDLCNDKDLVYKLNKSDNISTNKLAI